MKSIQDWCKNVNESDAKKALPFSVQEDTRRLSEVVSAGMGLHEVLALTMLRVFAIAGHLPKMNLEEEIEKLWKKAEARYIKENHDAHNVSESETKKKPQEKH